MLFFCLFILLPLKSISAMCGSVCVIFFLYPFNLHIDLCRKRLFICSASVYASFFRVFVVVVVFGFLYICFVSTHVLFSGNEVHRNYLLQRLLCCIV